MSAGTNSPQNARQAKPPSSPAPSSPSIAPPATPHSCISCGSGLNGHHTPSQSAKGKKRNDAPIDPAAMYESLKNRIAALEEEEVLEEEEERRFAEEAQKSVRGLEENAIHSKYIELFAELKRMERDHAKERQKLVKDKDAAKGQLTKANQTKTKMENLARELQKDNKRLREDGKRLAQSVEEAQEELLKMKTDFAKRADKARQQELKYREMPDIVVRVSCRYRPELFFKVSRKIQLSRLTSSWTERMEETTGSIEEGGQDSSESSVDAGNGGGSPNRTSPPQLGGMQFIFTYNGRILDGEQTPEDVGMDEGDEIIAVELMDLTEGGTSSEEWEDHVEPRREKLKKTWTDEPDEARRSVEEIFDSVARTRLKDVLRQYELRERHFECVIRSKELEVLLSRARATEYRHLSEGEKLRASKLEEEIRQLKKNFEDAQAGQALLIDKLVTCCKEIIQNPTVERTQRLFANLRDELERQGHRQFVKGEKNRISRLEEENRQLRRDLEDAQNSRKMVIDKLVACYQESDPERMQQLFLSLQEEVEKENLQTLNDFPDNSSAVG